MLEAWRRRFERLRDCDRCALLSLRVFKTIHLIGLTRNRGSQEYGQQLRWEAGMRRDPISLFLLPRSANSFGGFEAEFLVRIIEDDASYLPEGNSDRAVDSVLSESAHFPSQRDCETREVLPAD